MIIGIYRKRSFLYRDVGGNYFKTDETTNTIDADFI